MTRSAERLEGLCLMGEATLGGARLSVPQLLEATRDGERSTPSGSVRLIERPNAPPGHRLLRIGTEPPVDLTVPVRAPEIHGPITGAERLGQGALLIRGPVEASELSEFRSPTPELVILSNARQLFSEGEPFIRALNGIHTAFHGGPLLWAPRTALPHRLPLLVYLGIDLLDTTEGALQALHGVAFDPSLGGEERSEAIEEDAEVLALEEYRRALATVRVALVRGRLRELVESRLTTEPILGEMLRYADRLSAHLLEERAPVVGDARKGRYVLAESLRRPEMRRFRDRLVERYRPPPSKSALLFVPCSRTKPYRLSPSHRRFARAWEGQPHAERLHVVSVSSPIGVVPRELEDIYPARHYDIPVTGEWTEAEQDLVRSGVRHLVRTGRYRKVIMHLDPTEYGFLREDLETERPTVWTLGEERTTSDEAISSLREAVRGALEGVLPVPGGPLAVVREELHEVASWQFGREAADRLFQAPLRLLGRPWFQRLTDGARADLASLREERGLFHLTVAGGLRVAGADAMVVDVDAKVPLTGDVFAPGVVSASPAIRTGDAVLLRREGRVVAVGEAALPGPLMTTLGRGRAVWVRHRAPPATDTPIMEQGPAAPGPVV